MNLAITLKRTLKVSCWRVVGQVARPAERPEILSILLRLREQGACNAEDIATHLFFEASSRRVVAERMLRIAELYKLVAEEDRRRGWFSLTEGGYAAIESKEVFVPEFGTWTIWASEDPLLDSRILRVDVWEEPSAYDEVLGKDRDTERNFEKLPSWLNDLVGEFQRPCADSGREIRIDALQLEAEVVEPEADLEVDWDVAKQLMKVVGLLAGRSIDHTLQPPSHTPTQVWHELLQNEWLWEDWDESKSLLGVAFDSTSEAERESMTRRLEIEHPWLDGGIGGFDPLVVDGVGIKARSQPDAEDWASWRLQSRIREYATERRMLEWTKEAKAPFGDFDIKLPTRGELARDAWSERSALPGARTWHLVAAEDWGLK